MTYLIRPLSLFTITMTIVLAFTACRSHTNTSASNQHQSDRATTLPMWVVRDADSDIILIGSMHMLSEADHPLPAELIDAVKAADKVWFEADPVNDDNEAAMAEIHQAASYPDGDQLSAHISAATFERLETAAQPLGIPAEVLERYPAWYWYLALPFYWGTTHGYSTELGVDIFLQNIAQEKNIPVGGLEDRTVVFNMFKNIADPQSERLLQTLLSDLYRGEELLAEMSSNWRNGDLEVLQAWWDKHNPNFIEGTSQSSNNQTTGNARNNTDSFEKQVIGARNRMWLPTMQTSLADNQQDVFVVGIGHMLSDDSLLTLLQQAGYKTTQMTQ